MFRLLLVCSFLLLGACNTTSQLTVGLGTESSTKMIVTFQEALEETKAGFSKTWVNVNTNTSGTVTVISTYYRNNRPCREFVATIYGPNGTRNRYGDACRWKQYDWRVGLEGVSNSGRVVLQPQFLGNG